MKSILDKLAHSISCLLLAFLLFLLIQIDIKAQEYQMDFQRFDVEDGLPHRQINYLLQDRRGLLWIATSGGLTRFDGYRFTNFSRQSHGLSTNKVDWMVEDALGMIWLFSTNVFGRVEFADIINPITEEVFTLAAYLAARKQPAPIPLNNLSGIAYRTENGRIYLGKFEKAGVVSYHPNEGWKSIELPDWKYFGLVNVDTNGIIWALVGNDLKSNHLIQIGKNHEIQSQFLGSNNSILLSHLHGAGTNADGVFFSESQGSTFNKVWQIGDLANPKSVKLPAIVPVAEGVFSKLSHGHSLYNNFIFNDQLKIVRRLDDLFPELNGHIGLHIIQERFNPEHFWLATHFGLIWISVKPSKFKRYLANVEGHYGDGISCRGLATDGNSLWINTETPNKGFFCVNLKDNSEKSFSNGNGFAYAMQNQPDGTLWQDQSNEFEHNFIKRQKNNIDKQEKIINKTAFDYTWSIFQKSNQEILLGGALGLTVVNPVEKTAVKIISTKFPEFNSVNMVHIQPDRNGRIWTCTSKGLYLLDEGLNPIARYWNGGTGEFFLPADNFFHFYEDAAGDFWLGTGGDGLLRWNPVSKDIKIYGHNSGFVNLTIYAVYEDNHGHIWMPTDYGIAQFDKKMETVRRTWFPSDGISQYEFNRISHCRAPDGRLFFGGLNGITGFDPNDFYTKTSPSAASIDRPLVLSNFQIQNREADKTRNLTASLIESNKATLYPDDQYIEIEFAILDFFNRENAIYSWKIEGLDENWNFQPDPYLRINRLPYGKNKIHIRAQAADGKFAKNELIFEIYAMPPFYLRWWFGLLLASFLMAALYFGYKTRTQEHRRRAVELRKEVERQTATIRQQTEELQQMDVLKTQVYTNITHEFRTPLTVILGITEQLSEAARMEGLADYWQNKLDFVRRNGQNLLQLVNQLLDLAKIQSNTLELNMTHGNIVTYLAYLTDSFRGLAEQKQVSLSFESDQPDILMDYDIEKMRQIFVNLISNALKHSKPNGKIEVKICTIKPLSQFVLEIHDNGSGIAEGDLPHIFERFYQGKEQAKAGGTGLGLALVKELLDLHGGTILVESKIGLGSTFRILLPITNKASAETANPGAYQKETLPTALEAPNSPTYPHHETDGDLPKLLIVEDNTDVAAYIKDCLDAQYAIHLAANGREGIDWAINNHPDLIISDVMMPEVSGYELCETLKHDARTSHIPIVLLTARADSESKLAGLIRRADAYLTKPFDRRELQLVLDNLLEVRKQVQERYRALLSSMPLTENIQGENQAKDPKNEREPIVFREEPHQEDAFITNLVRYLEANLDNPDITLDDLCGHTKMGRSNLNAKMAALTGMSPMQYLRTLRLERASQLLQSVPTMNIAEVAYATGFDDPKYFSRVFSEKFGVSPSVFKSSHKQDS